jgi:hypothetical protein
VISLDTAQAQIDFVQKSQSKKRKWGGVAEMAEFKAWSHRLIFDLGSTSGSMDGPVQFSNKIACITNRYSRTHNCLQQKIKKKNPISRLGKVTTGGLALGLDLGPFWSRGRGTK